MKNELTDEQVEEITERHVRQVGDHWCHESAIVEADALEFARAVIAAHEALQAGQEPALVQYRMAANWNEPRRWTGWDDCSPEAAADYERIKVLHDWEYQVRRLYAAPQPAPDKDAEIAALTKQANAYASLVKNLDARMATLQAERGGWIEAVNTLTSERQANAMLTDEIAALKLRLLTAEGGAQEAAKAEVMYRDAERLLTLGEKELHAEIAALRKDAERFAAIANLDHVAINKWLVQTMTKESYQSAYFKAPSGGTPEVLHASKLDALRFAIDEAIAQAEQP